MNTDALIVEARARITWGEEPGSVRVFLISNGLSAAEADAQLKELMLERNADIRRLGIRDVIIGGVLFGLAGLFFYLLFMASHTHSVSARHARGFAVPVIAAAYGLWRLVNGIVRLVRPQSEHESISDISE